MNIDIENLPKIKSTQFSERITLAVSIEMKKKLDELKKNKKVDTPTILRNMINDFLDKVSA